MRRLLLACSFALALAGPARAQDATPADRTAIRSVIGRQIEHLRHDDAAGAFGLASPGIQAMFGTPEHFLAMVRGAYQPVYRPREVRFGTLASEDGVLVQHVALVGADGAPAEALYSMEREADGSWRIAGCALVQAARLQA